ncbi:MAG: hypothetical protein ACLFUT_06230, partial [Desulfobacteraceae bacterium]
HDAYELARVNEACKEHLESIYNGLVNIFENALDKGKADGSMVSVPPKKTALIIFSMVDGLVRFNTYELYDAGSLYTELITACRKMVRNQDNSGIGDKNA